MSSEQPQSFFEGYPRKIHRDERGSDVKRLIHELNFPFIKELVYAFINTTDPDNWIVGEMGLVGNVMDSNVWASMRLYNNSGYVHLDIYNKKIEQLKNEGFFGQVGDWSNGSFSPQLQITAGPMEAEVLSSEMERARRYGVSLIMDNNYGNGVRFPDAFNVWMLDFAAKLGRDYAGQYSGHYTDQPVFYPNLENKTKLKLFQKTRQIYAVRRRNPN